MAGARTDTRRGFLGQGSRPGPAISSWWEARPLGPQGSPGEMGTPPPGCVAPPRRAHDCCTPAGLGAWHRALRSICRINDWKAHFLQEALDPHVKGVIFPSGRGVISLPHLRTWCHLSAPLEDLSPPQCQGRVRLTHHASRHTGWVPQGAAGRSQSRSFGRGWRLNGPGWGW